MRTFPIFRAVPIVFGALAWSGTSVLASGQALEREHISPSYWTGTPTQQFGASLAADRDVMVAGAPFDDANGVDTGAAYVFRWDSTLLRWVEEQKLFPSDPEPKSGFGTAVAISGDAIVVGAPFEDNLNGQDAGAVYIFRFDRGSGSWVQERKLFEIAGAAWNEFGASVAISGNGLVVGVPDGETVHGANSGCAYVYRWLKWPSMAWVLEAKLVDPDGRAVDGAGFAVAMESDVVLVGSPFSFEASRHAAGSVAVWRNTSGWKKDQELTSSHIGANDEFGRSIAVSGDLVIVGAPLEDVTYSLMDSGAAYVFRYDGSKYVEEARFTHPSPAPRQWFGSDVDVSGDLVIIGAAVDDSAGIDAGSAFTFRRGRGAWSLDQQLGASDAAAGDHFGTQVVLNNAQILVAANGNDTSDGIDWGVVYRYPAAEMNLEITPSSPPAGAPLTIDAFYGTPGDLVLLGIVEVNGSPVFLPVVLAPFDVDHEWSTTAVTPDPPIGVEVGFQAFKISETGPIVASKVRQLDL